MKLHELRRLVRITESLDENTSVFFDFCGYTSDDEWIESIDITTDGECDMVNLGINGRAYEIAK